MRERMRNKNKNKKKTQPDFDLEAKRFPRQAGKVIGNKLWLQLTDVQTIYIYISRKHIYIYMKDTCLRVRKQIDALFGFIITFI
jgi:hypothetical protein